MLAESFGSGSIRKGITYPFDADYDIYLLRLMTEGIAGTIVVSASWIGVYFFSDYMNE